ncbi:methyltransferase domain-containing protein [Spirillospora sp. NBC_01491]|uniref:methyltransferase domain-containing protein n=1 Tax=Spirillospora sp. NBC_01491 TaxID=2976007 RepID=UPI002E2F28BB|nr:methyltransferase domain-containing protein [Spirillospora sp. NBC_01491]
MPTSDSEGKDWARSVIERIAPATVVDIGPGEGTYAQLAREATPGARWIAVEAWGPYVPAHGLWDLYDWVIVGDVRHVDPYSIVRQPDLVIVGDVLEHMAQAEARGVLARLRDWAHHILVSVPLAHHDQGEVAGNWFEIHREHWTGAQMRRELGPGLAEAHEGSVLGYYLWSADRAVRGGR